jgi:choline dehydrogenase-like flavoprotein
LRAVLDRLVPEDDFPPSSGAGGLEHADRRRAGDLAGELAVVQVGLGDLDAESLARFGSGFCQLTPAQQDLLLGAVEAGDVVIRWRGDAACFFNTVLNLAAEGYYADPANGGNRGAVSWSMVGYPPPLSPISPGRKPQVVRGTEHLRSRYDVVVVGGGAGGGVAAYVLARSGLEVLVVERGDVLGADEVPANHLRNHRLSRLGHNTGPPLAGNPRVLVDEEGEKLVVPHEAGWHNNAMTVGGGTRVWGAQAWRFSPNDFRMASTYGAPEASTLADWPIGYEDLEPFYDQVEQSLGVAGEVGHLYQGRRRQAYPMPPFPLGPSGQRLAAGAARLGWTTAAVPLMVNTVPYDGRPACARCSQCVGFACPVDAKTGTHNTVLADAVSSGHCTLAVGCRAVAVATGPGGRASGVTVMAEDGSGAARRVRAGAVVLAAGAIETARLLLLSGLGGPLVGTSLQGHTYVGAIGLFAEAVMDGLGPGPVIATCQFLHENADVVGGGMLANEFVKTPVSFWHTSLPPGGRRWGQEGKAAMREGYRRTLQVMGPVQEVPTASARVRLDSAVRDRLGLPVARLTGHGHPEDVRTAGFLAARARQWVDASGAQQSWAVPAVVLGPRLSAGQHQAGTCRMGTDPASSVCGPTAMLHECDNLVLADGSVHVTNGGVNPALTIMALAWRSAEALAERL